MYLLDPETITALGVMQYYIHKLCAAMHDVRVHLMQKINVQHHSARARLIDSKRD